jgi:hypothetical protein
MLYTFGRKNILVDRQLLMVPRERVAAGAADFAPIGL